MPIPLGFGAQFGIPALVPLALVCATLLFCSGRRPVVVLTRVGCSVKACLFVGVWFPIRNCIQRGVQAVAVTRGTTFRDTCQWRGQSVGLHGPAGKQATRPHDDGRVSSTLGIVTKYFCPLPWHLLLDVCVGAFCVPSHGFKCATCAVNHSWVFLISVGLAAQ